MDGGLLGEIFAFAPDAAMLTALAATVPLWFAVYLRCRGHAQRRRPELSLDRLEAIEYERALLLYEKTARRRAEIERARRLARTGWRGWYRRSAEFRRTYGTELEEIERYARDLRATILRLRGRPVRRYLTWIRVVSSRFALGRSLGCYGATLALLVVASWCFNPASWGPGADAGLDTYLLWQRADGRLLLANWMAESFAAAAAPLLYVIRRMQMYRAHAKVLGALRAFAALDPDRLIAQWQADAEAPTPEADAAEADAHEANDAVAQAPLAPSTWFEVLGVTPCASVDDVRQAYRLLIKQNHPDRVASMAPPFKELAEAETKKLNIAYAEALSFLRGENASIAA